MLERREFIRIMGISAAALLFFPDNILFAGERELNDVEKIHQPRRILYGSKYSGCSGWHGGKRFCMPPDIR